MTAIAFWRVHQSSAFDRFYFGKMTHWSSGRISFNRPFCRAGHAATGGRANGDRERGYIR